MNRISRRRFTKILSTGAAYAALSPSSAFSSPLISPSNQAGAGPIVRLSSNENPHGPSPIALRSMTDAFGLAWRYPDEHADMLAEKLAKLHGVANDQILLGNGSGEVLKLCASAFTSKERKLVMADPTFEAIGRHAVAAQAEVLKVKLAPGYSHDLPRMLSAARDAGLVYICNPNNPTASLTKKQDIRAFVSEVSRPTTVLIDEAYHHYVDSDDYESTIPLVKDYPNLIVARTFSKIYGMAGLRFGYCVASSDSILRMRTHQSWDNVNIMALVAATASLDDKDHVELNRRRNKETKQQVQAELDKLGYRYISSHTNFMMIDLRREVKPVIASLAQRNVQVGRVFPSLPNFLRVTIGTRPQMETFISAFRQVVAA
jgi:histidinol-phosphate aminotransferase